MKHLNSLTSFLEGKKRDHEVMLIADEGIASFAAGDLLDICRVAQATQPMHKSSTKSVPYVKGSDTSKAAAKSMKNYTGALREVIFKFVKAKGKHGATCDEIEEQMNLRHQSASARVNELEGGDVPLLVDSGERRLTRSGRKARVLVTADTLMEE